MKTLIVKKTLDFNFFELLDAEKNTFLLQLEFYNLPSFGIGDQIVFKDERLLDKTSSVFTQPYAFEMANVDCEKKQVFENDPNITVAKIGGKTFCLKRIYG